MGLEASCEVEAGGKRGHAKALLETTELVVRGASALRIPLKEVVSADACRGVLHVVWPGGIARLHLGSAAEKWALKIRYPKSLADKLGVKPGAAVSVIGVDEAAVLAVIAARTEALTRGRVKRGAALVLFGVSKVAQLARLTALRAAIAPDGAIWVVWPKGRKELREDDVRAAAKRSGLVDVKVASVSETLSGLKLVIPVAQRPRR